MGVRERIDHAQQDRRKLGIAVATVKKYSEDSSSDLASMIAFWAFFSIFPLFLVGVTVLGFALSGGTRTSVLQNVARLFPLLDPSTVGGLAGAWWAIVVGGVSALWSGLAVMKATQRAFDTIWAVPDEEQPALLGQVLRSLFALATIGVGLIAATLVSGFVTGDQSAVNLAWYSRVGGYAVSLALDMCLFMLAFRILTARDTSFRAVRAGALLSGGAFWVLQQVSTLIVSRYLQGAQSTYGAFATVLTVLWWFYLQAQITLVGAQLNVVLAEGLHPRSLFDGPATATGPDPLEEDDAGKATRGEREKVEAGASGGGRTH